MSGRGPPGVQPGCSWEGPGGNPGWPWNPRVSGRLWAASREVVSEVFRVTSRSSVMANLSWPK